MIPPRPVLRKLLALPATAPAALKSTQVPNEPLPETLPRLPDDWTRDASSTCIMVGLGDLEPDEILLAAAETSPKDVSQEAETVAPTPYSPPQEPPRAVPEPAAPPVGRSLVKAGLTMLVSAIASAALGFTQCLAVNALLHR